MKIPVTIVPKEKCALNILRELGDRTKNSWIYLHKDVVDVLLKSADKIYEERKNDYWFYRLKWNANDEFPETIMELHWNTVISEYLRMDYQMWVQVYSINAKGIAFRHPAKDPEEIFFLNMEA